MKPSLAQMLMMSAGELGQSIAPALPTAFLQGAAQLAALMAVLAAQEAERGAAVRVGENAQLRALFAALAPFAEPALRGELEAAASARDDDLAISALDAANAKLRLLLIALQEQVAQQHGAQAAEMEIWQVLAACARAREFHLG